MRGGSRYGAGRPAYKGKCEGALSLDIRDLIRRGLLNAGNSFGWSWYRNDSENPSSSVSIQVPWEGNRLVIDYTARDTNQAHILPIYFVETPCHLGGHRKWLQCPRCHCKAAKVYYRRQTWACRKCQRMAYTSQSEDEVARLHRSNAKIERRLDDDRQRPKGMHETTYNRMTDKIWRNEEALDNLLCEFIARWGFVL